MTDERPSITAQMIDDALKKLPVMHDAPLYYVSRSFYAAHWAAQNGWRYFLGLYWKARQWPRTFAGIKALSGAEQLEYPPLPHWRFAARTMTLDDESGSISRGVTEKSE